MKSGYVILSLAVLIALMCSFACAAEEVSSTASSTIVEKKIQTRNTTFEEEQANKVLDKLRVALRGSGATCRFENTDTFVKTFICDLKFEKKVAFKKVSVSGTLTMVAHLTKQKIQIKFAVAGNTIYNTEFAMGLVNLDPICVDFIMEVGFCLQVRNIRFALNEQCIAFDIDGYFKAFGFKESVLKQPVGYNVNKC